MVSKFYYVGGGKWVCESPTPYALAVLRTAKPKPRKVRK